MYKRSVVTVIIAFVFTLCLVVPGQAGWFGPNRVEKAEEAMRAKMPNKAIKLLKEEIDENPSNARAHYKLGMTYLGKAAGKAKQKVGFFNLSGYFDDAIERFGSAISLEPKKYRDRVVNYLFDLCFESINADDAQNAYDIVVDGLYPLGVSKNKVVNEFWEKGEAFFQAGYYKGGHQCFRIVHTEDNSRDRDIARLYAKYADKADNVDDKLYLLKWGKQFHSSVAEEYGQALLEKAKATKDADQKEKLLNKATEYLPDKEVFEIRVAHYTDKFGVKPSRISLTDGTWKLVEEVHEGDIIYYMAKHDFLGIDEVHDKPYKIGESSSPYKWKMTNVKEGGEEIRFKKKDKNVEVIVWFID